VVDVAVQGLLQTEYKLCHVFPPVCLEALRGQRTAGLEFDKLLQNFSGLRSKQAAKLQPLANFRLGEMNGRFLGHILSTRMSQSEPPGACRAGTGIE
jgi:hypothetical protein